MTLYSKGGSMPAPLPAKLILPDGTTRTGSGRTPEAIADAGYVESPGRPTTQWYERVVWNGGSLTWVVDNRPLADVIAERVRAVENRHDTVLESGFAYDFGTKTATLPDGTTEPAGVRTIQTRSQDRERWQATMQVAQQYIMAGAPTEPMRPFRTEDNASIPMTAQDVADCLNAMQAFFGQALDAIWKHKDAVRSLTTVDDVVAYDITTGWE